LNQRPLRYEGNLGDHLDGSLPRHTRELVAFHTDGCPPCVAFINTYRGTIDAARKSFETPEHP